MKTFALAAPCLALSLVAPLASADNLIQNAGFEEPKITGRVSAPKGGSPASLETGTTWAHFQSMDQTGKVIVGLTDEFARSGKQSIFVQFDEAEKVRGAFLMSDLIPVKAEETYRVSIWGRVDRKRPLTLDQGRPYQLLEVDFYPADQTVRIGETAVRTQMIPGMADRLLFISSKWSEYYAEFRAPTGAEFMKVTFKWESPKREGPADGVIYFDDATVEGVVGTGVPSLDPPEPVEAAAGATGPGASKGEAVSPKSAPTGPDR
ncbi:MAG: hypothetical protein WCF18_02025 [Chthoniobacteraceae bacterium]